MNLRQLFLDHVAQTSPSPLAIEIRKAKGSKLWDAEGKEYLDLISGISVCNIGHRHPQVLRAIKKQLDQYLHVLVYGEMIESPQVQYAKLLTDNLPPKLNSVYFTNSGTEAVEGAMKLAKRFTGRTGILAFKNAYHGSTQGALSVIGDEFWRNSFRPLLPDILHLDYNSLPDLDNITDRTACVIAETIQAEAGVVVPSQEWMQQLRRKCTATGTLLILDEIQTGFGRCGSLWGFEKFEIEPDIVLLGKALGGGMPLGAFVADKKIMNSLTLDPVLGHITTFGGHPVCCAAGLAAMKVLLKERLFEKVGKKEKLFRSLLQHQQFNKIHSYGLLIAIELDNAENCRKIIDHCISKRILTDWFLFSPQSVRIAPPLNISNKEIRFACKILNEAAELVI